KYVVTRDLRGVAALRTLGPPFVDLTGAKNAPDGLPDLDPLGRFVTTGPVPSPFFSVDGVDGKRDDAGRALEGAELMYEYRDTTRTFLGAVIRDVQPLLNPDPQAHKDAVMNLMGGLPILFGSRDANASATKTYAPDPLLPEAWKLMHKTPPANLGQTPVALPYRAFHAEDSPLVDLVYAVGQLLGDATFDDTLSLFRKLLVEHPK